MQIQQHEGSNSWQYAYIDIWFLFIVSELNQCPGLSILNVRFISRERCSCWKNPQSIMTLSNCQGVMFRQNQLQTFCRVILSIWDWCSFNFGWKGLPQNHCCHEDCGSGTTTLLNEFLVFRALKLCLQSNAVACGMLRFSFHMLYTLAFHSLRELRPQTTTRCRMLRELSHDFHWYFDLYCWSWLKHLHQLSWEPDEQQYWQVEPFNLATIGGWDLQTGCRSAAAISKHLYVCIGWQTCRDSQEHFSAH